MSQPIVIADTSTTIQKVIKITLSEGPFSVDTCLSEQELREIIVDGQSYIVLLDINLVPVETMGQFIEDIKNLNRNINIVLLYTTRDQTTADSLESVEKVSILRKPFETEELIEKCQMLAAVEENTPLATQEGMNDFSSESISADVGSDDNAEWEISVPGVIGFSQESTIELPDIISSGENSSQESMLESEGMQGPTETSTFDPDPTNPMFSMDDFKASEGSTDFPEPISSPEPIVDISDSTADNQFPEDSDLEFPDTSIKPSFDSVDDLNLEEEVTTSPGLQLEEEEQEEEHGNWESSDPATFWTPDNNQEEQDLLQLDDQNKGEVFFTSENHVEADQTTEIMDKLMPVIEKMVKEYCNEAVEKIAWEVIPDLAENLIQSELKSIKEETLKQP